MGGPRQRPGSLGLIAALLAGCAGSASAAPPTAPAPTPVAAIDDARGPAAAPAGEPVSIRRRHRQGDRYQVVTTFELGDTPIHPDLGYTTWANADVALGDDGGVVARGRFHKSLLTHGDEVNPLGDDSNLAGVEVGLWLDPQNRVVRDELSGQSLHNESFARVVRDSLRAVRVYYPDGPVRVGDSWTADPLRWDTRPAGWVVVNVQPTYTLEAVGRRGEAAVARVRWSGIAEIEPFEVGGISLSARIPIDGISLIDLDDGYTATHDIRGRVELFLTAGAGHLSNVASMRIRQVVTRR